MSIERTQRVLTEGVIAQWEFHLSDPGILVQFDQISVCPRHPGHVRVFFETPRLPDEDDKEPPEHAYLIELFFMDDDCLGVTTEYYRNGVAVILARFVAQDLVSFFRDDAENVAHVMRLLRAMAPTVKVDTESCPALLN